MPDGTTSRRTLSVHAVIALLFAGAILLYALVLMLPVSSRSGAWTDPITALFTAASAVCVTGLAVVDTAQHYSLFGRAVILLAIQTGGLGVMTVMALAALLLGQRIGLKKRSMLLEGISALQLGGVVRLTRRALKITLCAELLGAILLCVRFVPRMGLLAGSGHALFLAVSAFCNAGFDLMGTVSGPFSSLSAFASDAYVLLTLSALILLGGLGFFVYDDLIERRFFWRRLQLHTRAVLLALPILVVIPALLLFLLEAHASMRGMSTSSRLGASLFLAVTPRTAGFSCVPVSSLSSASLLLTMGLMLIGGCPGSTAGGMKVTTVLVLFLLFGAVFRREEDVHLLHRRLPAALLRRACAIAAGYLLLIACAAFSLCALQPELDPLSVLFEAVSAMTTAGLSMGVTASLAPLSRLIVILLMVLGRLGSLTLALLTTRSSFPTPIRYPADRLLIG